MECYAWGEKKSGMPVQAKVSLHHFDSSKKMVVVRKISHFFPAFTSLKQHIRALLKKEKKSIQKSISSPTVFCFLKTSVFSFCLNTSAALSHFTLSLEPLCFSHKDPLLLCLCFQVCRGSHYLKIQTKQMFSSDRPHTVRKLRRMQRNKYDCTCAFVCL